FQAEDGIRDFHVTGVQTCALPISPPTGGVFLCAASDRGLHAPVLAAGDLRAQREFQLEARPASRRRVDRHLAARLVDAVGDAPQAEATAAAEHVQLPLEALAVIAHLH